jgi:hypothetical protein
MDKERELNHLLRFKEVCPYFPDGEIECTEKPDFIVHASNSLLGIEHTEIFQPGPSDGSSLQAQDSLGEKVVCKAYNLYSNEHTKPLFVQILFNPRVVIGKKDVDHLAKAIVNLIEMTPIESGLPITLRRTRENLAFFPIGIVMLHICDHVKGKGNKWFSSSAGWIPEVSSQYLQEKITNKEQKLDLYKTKCLEIWLLLVADNARIPSSVDLNQVELMHHYSTKYNRVFLFWNSTCRYVELQLSNQY